MRCSSYALRRKGTQCSVLSSIMLDMVAVVVDIRIVVRYVLQVIGSNKVL